MPERVKGLSKKGLTLHPKNYKNNVKGFKNSVISTDWEYTNYPTLGAYTGKKAGIIVFDIDKLNLVPKSIKTTLLESKTLTVWADNIDNKKTFNPCVHEKFKMIYACDSKDLKDISLLNEFGLEVFYGKSVAIYGAYNYEKEYRYSGDIKPLPDSLNNFLSFELKRKNKKSKKSVQIDFELAESPYICIESILKEYNQDYKIKNPDTSYLQDNANETYNQIYITECFCKDEHTSYNSSQMEIFVNKNGYIQLSCWHNSCKNSLKSVEKKLNNSLDRIYKPISNTFFTIDKFRNMSIDEVSALYD